jgi:hypothetical protein
MIRVLILCLFIGGPGVAQPINNDLYFSVVKKDIERIFNAKKEKDPLFHWSFRSLKTFPLEKGESCLLPCCREEKNYYDSIIYMVDGSLVHLIVGVRSYRIGENRFFYKAYRFDLLRDKTNNLTWKITEELSKETDRYDDLP